MAAVVDNLETALVGLIQALGLQLGSTSVQVERQNTASFRQGLESAPLITVSGAQIPGRERWWSTGGPGEKGEKRREYNLQVSFSAGGNRDQKTNEGTYQLWRQKVQGCVEPLGDWGVPELYDCVIEPGPWVSTGTHQKNLDTSRLIIRTITIEPATN